MIYQYYDLPVLWLTYKVQIVQVSIFNDITPKSWQMSMDDLLSQVFNINTNTDEL